MIAKVCIDRNASSLNEYYDYIVPESLIGQISVGCSVIVPFGFDEVKGYVYELVDKSNTSFTKKEIIDVVNDASDFGPYAFDLASSISSDLNCSFASIYSMMLPSFIKGNKKTYLHIINYENIDANLALVLKGKNKVAYSNELKEYKNLIDKESQKGNIKKGYEFLYYGHNKVKKVYSVLNNEKQSSPIRNSVINYLNLHKGSSLEDIQISTGASSNIIRALVKNGAILEEEIKEDRKKENADKKLNKNISFRFEEENAYSYFNTSSISTPTLFVSNDDDFRLNFYLKLIEDATNEDKKVVIVVPSILKGEQLNIKLKRYLKNYRIILYHSLNKVSDNYDYYEDILNDNYDCLICVLASCFLPFKNVKSMVLEDACNLAYISDSYPYVSLKEVMLKKQQLLNARLLLSCQTPSIEDYYKARNNVYNLIEVSIPSTAFYKVVNMNEEIIEENNVILSSTLKKTIDDALANGRVSALVCNNLSFSTQIRCRGCGKVLKCPKCKVPLTYSKKKNEVRCGYCGYKEESFTKCKCGETNFISFGFGLEQVVEKVKELYPDKRIYEVSSQSLSSNTDIDNILSALEDGSVDILVGTNAIVSLLDSFSFDCVGFLYMDSFLNAQNFLGSELTYNLIAHASKANNVIIQSYYCDSYVYSEAIKGSWYSFYQAELENREMLFYPPFSCMSKVIVKGDYNEMFHFAYYLKKALSFSKDVECLGPTYDYKVMGVSLIIKYKDYSLVYSKFKDAQEHFEKEKISASIMRFSKGG